MSAAISLGELITALDDLGWDEQVAFEASERSDMPDDIDVGAEERLRALARQVTPALLNELERRPGYVVWALRLSPLVSGDTPAVRATRHAGDPDPRIRFCVEDILRRPHA